MPYKRHLRRSLEGIEVKCRKCRQWWFLEQFAKSKLCRYGRTLECNACRSERRQRYRGKR